MKCSVCNKNRNKKFFSGKYSKICNSCKREYSKQWYRENRESKIQYKKEYAFLNPGKIKAHKAIQTATEKGIINRPNKCPKCKTKTRILAIQLHGYSDPLDFKWLCNSCGKAYRKKYCK